jgi:hypothetical protein
VLIPDLKDSYEENDCIFLRAPKRSIADWDVGKDPYKVEPDLPKLSMYEWMAIQRYIVFSNIFKVNRLY